MKHMFQTGCKPNGQEGCKPGTRQSRHEPKIAATQNNGCTSLSAYQLNPTSPHRRKQMSKFTKPQRRLLSLTISLSIYARCSAELDVSSCITLTINSFATYLTPLLKCQTPYFAATLSQPNLNSANDPCPSAQKSRDNICEPLYVTHLQ